jgi:hypothetical protein
MNACDLPVARLAAQVLASHLAPNKLQPDLPSATVLITITDSLNDQDFKLHVRGCHFFSSSREGHHADIVNLSERLPSRSSVRQGRRHLGC